MRKRICLVMLLMVSLAIGCQQTAGEKAEEKKTAQSEEKTAEPATAKPVAEVPATREPVAEKPAEEKPAEEKPAEEKPAEEKPAEEKPAEEKPAEEKPADVLPAEEDSGEVEKKSEAAGNPVVIIETSMGTFKVELYPDKTPVTVANFLRYVDDSFYTGAIFHRVVRGFVIQAGGFDPDYGRRLTREPIANEAATGLPNERGTIAMARTNQRNSASSQFYVNLRNNEMLNFRDETRDGWGYCAFGRVIEGMDVVDKIGEVETSSGGPFRQDVPKSPVTLVSVRRAE